ncbi:MAG: Bifunctional protein GlmU [Firmicutes bacterium ADurb.Bin193]|nr:MAG: Bifunctional protein GlmU [Firmicutes bacterium ADurb.Bin193]
MYSALILAAGEGKRMKSAMPKVLHEVMFKPVIRWVVEAAAGAQERIVVVGHGADKVKEYLGGDVLYACQEVQLGTGHAVMQARELIKNCECIAVLSGDTPLITARTLDTAYSYHKSSGNIATVLTANVPDPYGYGRIVRGQGGDVVKIVEHRDATEKELEITEINSGIYFFDTKELLSALNKITTDNAQGEYYLTDTIEILLSEGKKVGAFLLDDHNEILGINDRIQLAAAGEIMRKRIVLRHMQEGVTFLSPDTAYISGEAQIGSDTIIMPNSIIEGKTVIGNGCIIGPNSRIVDSKIGSGTKVDNSVVTRSEIGADANIGPFAYIRPGCVLGDGVKAGDFVEVKNSVIGKGTKMSHLTYVGDADIGEGVNFGCGTVVVNYDGIKKHRSQVGDNAFIGCNVNLISPVKVGKGVFIAAGSTITDDIPDGAFAIARSRQTVKTDWKRK